MPVKTHKVRLYPNKTMADIMMTLMDYNRFCWNQGLSLWNDMYQNALLVDDKKLRPTERKVRDVLVRDKADWQFRLSARVLQQSIHRLGQAWQNFFNPQMPHANKPKFHRKRSSKQSFTTDRAQVKGQYLLLDRPHEAEIPYYPIKMAESLRFAGKIKTVTITKRGPKFFASISVVLPESSHSPFYDSWDIAAIDLNVDHVDWNEGRVSTYTHQMATVQTRIKHYQRLLARKRQANPSHYHSHNYQRVQAHLNRAYERIRALQQELVNTFTHHVTATYAVICIEDLDVNAMKMSKHKAKNIQRGLFGRLCTTLVAKCSWRHKQLIVADRFYPSTQRCSHCGFVKTKTGYGGKMTLHGDSIHRDHHTYRCYHCGAVLNRDINAVENLRQYAAGLSAETATVV